MGVPTIVPPGIPPSKYYLYGTLGYKPAKAAASGHLSKPVSSSTPLPLPSVYQTATLPFADGDGAMPVHYVPVTAQPTVPAVTDAFATVQATASLTHETTLVRWKRHKMN